MELLLGPFQKYELYMLANGVPEEVHGMMRAAFIAGLCHGIHLGARHRTPEQIVALLEDVTRLAKEMQAEALTYRTGHA